MVSIISERRRNRACIATVQSWVYWGGALRQFESELLALGERLDDPGVVRWVPGHELGRSSRKEPVGVGLRADVLHLRPRIL